MDRNCESFPCGNIEWLYVRAYGHFVYTMIQVQICACTRICIWRMYIIELLSEMVYKVYKSSRSQPTRLWRETVCEGGGCVADLEKE